MGQRRGPDDREPADGGRRSFEDLYTATAGRLVAQLFVTTGDLEEARDCVQEAFARAWLRWDALCVDDTDPIAWVYTVGYRIAVSRFRRRVAHLRAVRRSGPSPQVSGPTGDTLAVRDALAALPHGQRAALVLHYYEGLTVEAIARVLGVTPSAVKSRLARGRAAMHHLVEDGPGRPGARPGPTALEGGRR